MRVKWRWMQIGSFGEKVCWLNEYGLLLSDIFFLQLVIMQIDFGVSTNIIEHSRSVI